MDGDQHLGSALLPRAGAVGGRAGGDRAALPYEEHLRAVYRKQCK